MTRDRKELLIAAIGFLLVSLFTLIGFYFAQN